MTDSSNLSDSIKTVLITGGTGLVGTVLSKLLTEKGFKVTHLSRNPTQGTYQTFHWDIKSQKIEEEAITSADAIIHLAGAGVADKRWSDSWKKTIYDSRIDSTKLLRKYIEKHNPMLKHFISASAIGIYGWDTGDKLVNEETKKGLGFLADVVEDWEKEVSKFSEIGVKHSKVRIGVVLSEGGGALQEMSKPIKMLVGSPLASGKQYLSWIHIDDLCAIFAFLLEKGEAETVNGVGPNPATNREFTNAVAQQLNKPLWLPNMPAFALKLIVGEMADILIGGNNVSSKKIENLGFNFRYPTLDGALQNLLH
jgi:uncharacterized protein